jgi:hypothetical protein
MMVESEAEASQRRLSREVLIRLERQALPLAIEHGVELIPERGPAYARSGKQR